MPADGLADDFGRLLGVLARLGGIDARVGGGWGIDVLAGRVTRPHADVDVFVPQEDVDRAATDVGGRAVVDERPCRVVLVSGRGTRVDVNGIAYSADGTGIQKDDVGEIEVFGEWAWCERTILGRTVRCLTAEAQRLKHRGYAARPWDAADIGAIAHIRDPSRFDPTVRHAEPADEALLGGIESTADRLYTPFGLWPLPPLPGGYHRAEDARTAATLVAGRPAVGFCRLEDLDDHAHIGQLSVLPEYGRMGIGTSLVEAACSWAARHGRRLVTLTTFAEVPFNAPWYARLGFGILGPPFGPGLSGVVDEERDLERLGPRAVMGRRVGSGKYGAVAYDGS